MGDEGLRVRGSSSEVQRSLRGCDVGGMSERWERDDEGDDKMRAAKRYRGQG